MDEKKTSSNVDELDKIDIVSVLIRSFNRMRANWPMLLILLLLGAGFGFWREWATYTEKYQAYASFSVSAGESNNVALSQYYNKLTVKQLNATFPYILTSGALSQVVAKDLGVSSVPGQITTEVVGETNLFQINVVASNGQTAYDILQSVIENYPTVARYIIGNTQLKLLDESGVPTEPMNQPNYRNSCLKWMLMVFVLYAGCLIIWELGRRTIKNHHDLKKYLNMKYLGGIPKVRFKRRSHNVVPQILVDNSLISTSYSEAIETVQERLTRILKEKGWNAFLITSALPGEGKTTTACNLGLSLAQQGYRVLLIDGDLRNPSVADHLNLKNVRKGLVDVLSDKAKADDVIVQYEQTNMYVLPGGKPVSSAASLYSNGVLARVIQQYKATMDYVVFDTPPCAFMHDTMLIAPSLEAGIMIIRQDYAHVNKIVSGAELLTQAGLPLIGYAINEETSGIGSYGYEKYGYGNYGYGQYGYGQYSSRNSKAKKV